MRFSSEGMTAEGTAKSALARRRAGCTPRRLGAGWPVGVGSADRTVAAQVHIATEAATRLPETDAGGGAAMQRVFAEAVAAVPPPPDEPGPDPRFIPRSETRPS